MKQLFQIFFGLTLLASTSSQAESIRIAVASNFAPTLAVLADQYEQSTGQSVVLISGSTGKHYAQIVNGAPFDAFFAADHVRPELLERNGLAIAGSRFSYAHGRLVLAGSLVDTHSAVAEILQREPFRFLAMANPDLAPYGLAAREVLIHLGLWDGLQDRLVHGENIAQVHQFVHSGNTELGFLSLAQTHASSWNVGDWILIPVDWHSPIDQQAVLLKEPARGFMSYVRSTAARETIREQGYELP